MNPVELVVGEGLLDARAAGKILRTLGVPFDPARCIDKGGRVAFWRDAPRYNEMARNDGLVLALTDLDRNLCAPGLIAERLGRRLSSRFLLRIASRMLESWLLADTSNIAGYLHVSAKRFPRDPDSVGNPKQTIVNLARDSRSRQVREDLVPETGTTAPVGKNYTRAMEKFIDTHWDPLEASHCSPSLARAIRTIQSATSL